MKLLRLHKLLSFLRRIVSLSSTKPFSQRRYAAYLRALVAAPPWCFDFVQVAEDHIEIRGWALIPKAGASRVTFTINDIEFDHILFPLPWPKIARIFWYWPTATTSGFICRANRSHAEAFVNGYATFKYVDRTTNEPLNPTHNYYYPDPAIHAQLPIPAPARRKRVHGDALASAFVLEGFSTYTKLAHILYQVTDLSYADFANILDWGCGCGRLTRYFGERTPATLTGIDIDADNVAWCQQHLPAGRFLHISAEPPTPLEAATFDLIIGISIFTHLREADQFYWLDELARIARPRALLLVTVHGNTTVGRAQLPAAWMAELERTGFLDAGHNPDLDGYTSDHGYYRNTFHTEAYIRERWTAHFEILRIVPGAIGNNQDVVVMRKV